MFFFSTAFRGNLAASLARVNNYPTYFISTNSVTVASAATVLHLGEKQQLQTKRKGEIHDWQICRGKFFIIFLVNIGNCSLNSCKLGSPLKLLISKISLGIKGFDKVARGQTL